MKKGIKSAAHLHENIPPDWYFRSIKENILQNYWHNRRFDEVKRLIEPIKGKSLDIGSADGVFTKVALDKSGTSGIVGIEVLKSSVDWANSHWKKYKKMSFRVGDAHKLEFKENSFDAVFAFEVLEHVASPDLVLKEIRRVLNKGGYAIFMVPTDSLLFKTLWDYVWTKTRGKIWSDTHIQSFRNGSLIELSKEIGFKVEVDKKFLLGCLQVVKVRK